MKTLLAKAGDVGPIPGSGRSPGGGHGNPLQYPGYHIQYPVSPTPVWRIPWTEEPGGLESMGSQSWTRLKRLSTRTHSVITRALRKREAGGDLTTEEERACDGRNRGSGDVVL